MKLKNAKNTKLVNRDVSLGVNTWKKINLNKLLLNEVVFNGGKKLVDYQNKRKELEKKLATRKDKWESQSFENLKTILNLAKCYRMLQKYDLAGEYYAKGARLSKKLTGDKSLCTLMIIYFCADVMKSMFYFYDAKNLLVKLQYFFSQCEDINGVEKRQYIRDVQEIIRSIEDNIYTYDERCECEMLKRLDNIYDDPW